MNMNNNTVEGPDFNPTALSDPTHQANLASTINAATRKKQDWLTTAIAVFALLVAVFAFFSKKPDITNQVNPTPVTVTATPAVTVDTSTIAKAIEKAAEGDRAALAAAVAEMKRGQQTPPVVVTPAPTVPEPTPVVTPTPPATEKTSWFRRSEKELILLRDMGAGKQGRGFGPSYVSPPTIAKPTGWETTGWARNNLGDWALIK
jgi:hypothetical protein